MPSSGSSSGEERTDFVRVITHGFWRAHEGASAPLSGGWGIGSFGVVPEPRGELMADKYASFGVESARMLTTASASSGEKVRWLSSRRMVGADASPNVPEMAAFGCEAAITRSDSLEEAFPNRIEALFQGSRYSSLAPSSEVKWGGKAKHPSRFWELSLCTPSARSDTSSYLSLLCRSC
jgi:hypothetical protein